MSAAQNGSAPVTPDSGGTAVRGPQQSESGASERKRTPTPPHTHAACGATWTGTSAAHCSGCHQTFSGVGLFDRHRSLTGEHGQCADPATMRSKAGDRICELRDGIWRYPEMDEETKRVRFGRAS